MTAYLSMTHELSGPLTQQNLGTSGMSLYGQLVVYEHDPNENDVDNDVVIIADDGLLNSNEQVDANTFGNLGHWSHGGRLGNALSINGKFKPAIHVSSRGPVRLRCLKAGRTL